MEIGANTQNLRAMSDVPNDNTGMDTDDQPDPNALSTESGHQPFDNVSRYESRSLNHRVQRTFFSCQPYLGSDPMVPCKQLDRRSFVYHLTGNAS